MKGDNGCLTIGEFARLAGVSPRCAAKWFDRGLVSGYRLPHSGDRRVPRADVVRFLTERGMPLGELGPTPARVVLAVGVSRADVVRLGAALGDSPRVEACGDLLLAGLLVRDAKPRCAVLDDVIGSAELRSAAAVLVAEGVRVVALVGPDAADVSGAHATFRHPIDPAAVAAEVRRQTADPDARTVKVTRKKTPTRKAVIGS